MHSLIFFFLSLMSSCHPSSFTGGKSKCLNVQDEVVIVCVSVGYTCSRTHSLLCTMQN